MIWKKRAKTCKKRVEQRKATCDKYIADLQKSVKDNMLENLIQDYDPLEVQWNRPAVEPQNR